MARDNPVINMFHPMDAYHAIRSYRILLLLVAAPLLPPAISRGEEVTPQQRAADLKLLHQIQEQVKALEEQEKKDKAQLAILAMRVGSQTPIAEASKSAASASATAAASSGAATQSPAAPDDGSASKDSANAVTSQKDDLFEVPDSPSAAILGVTPQKITRPSDPKSLIGSVLNGVDENGNFQTGVAIDVAPFKFFLLPKSQDNDGNPLENGPFVIALADKDYYERVLLRTQFSFVTAKGTTNADKAVRLGVGIQMTLMDNADPYVKAEAAKNAPAKVAERPRLGRDYNELKNEEYKWFYNASWNVGAAQEFISQTGNTSDYKSGGYGVYSTYSYGFEGIDDVILDRLATYMQKNDQLLFQVQYRDHDSVPDVKKKGAFIDEDRAKLALRFRFGDEDFNASFDGSFTEEKDGGGSYKPAYSIAFDIDKKIAGNTYLTLSLGKEFDHPDGNNPVLAIGGVKVGFSPSAAQPQ